MPFLDLLYFLAVAAIGLGLSLMTYRWFAMRYDWPMGTWHRNRPGLPILLGILSVLVGLFFAYGRTQHDLVSGWSIVVVGVLLAILWTGILRVASQVSLIAAPAAAVILMVPVLGGPDALEYHTVRTEVRELRKALEENGAIALPRTGDQQRR